ncbi:uncharacterized protein MONBRDRAFT_33415 [Monosiga brevicollis MX1]|uniref:Secreted protein n=1 Tax=Monosiga brevicollis TaxID=81824 RepID=A9V599_MONBE|nr:uncharacterized protein MONBRDRAFT_33415 [Monosiga brevicollis MX1]EDQ87240.1 predicted protein [Monosiga brevicollis MX1]|eukprot:XP_001747853.1 hypothetical protein [Monosiga brevicollis MX1]
MHLPGSWQWLCGLFLVVAATGVDTVAKAEEQVTSCPVPSKGPIHPGIFKHSQALAELITNHFVHTADNANFEVFLQQDLLYLMQYAEVVRPGLDACRRHKNPCLRQLIIDLESKLSYGDSNANEYKEMFNIQHANEPNEALLAYFDFYKSHHETCEATIAAMQVCLCSYKMVAKALNDALNNSPADGMTSLTRKRLEDFVFLNGGDAPIVKHGMEGSTCAIGRTILGLLGSGGDDASFLDEPTAQLILEKAVQLEARLWHVPIASEASAESPMPHAGEL